MQPLKATSIIWIDYKTKAVGWLIEKFDWYEQYLQNIITATGSFIDPLMAQENILCVVEE